MTSARSSALMPEGRLGLGHRRLGLRRLHKAIVAEFFRALAMSKT